MSNCYREEVYKVTKATLDYLCTLNEGYRWDPTGRRFTDFGGGLRVRGDVDRTTGEYIVVTMTVRRCCMGLEYYAPLGLASYTTAEQAFDLVDFLMDCEPQEYEVWEVVESYDHETMYDRLPHYSYVYDEYFVLCAKNLKTGKLTPMNWCDRFEDHELDALVDYDWKCFDRDTLLQLLTVYDVHGVRRWLPVTYGEVSAALAYSAQRAKIYDSMPF